MTHRTMYLVSSGSYSGYQVLGVFESKADAEQFANPADDYNGPFVEERRMWEPGETPEQWQRIEVYGGCSYDGSTLVEPRETPGLIIGWSDDDGPQRLRTQITPGNVYHPDGHHNGEGWSVYVSGSDIERVRKVFSEAFAYARTLGPPVHEPYAGFAEGSYRHGLKFSDPTA